MFGEYKYIKVTNSEESFRTFFTQYFADCTMIVSKIKYGFYTTGQIKEMFIAYNKSTECGKIK
jgi:hypothetical protein